MGVSSKQRPGPTDTSSQSESSKGKAPRRRLAKPVALAVLVAACLWLAVRSGTANGLVPHTAAELPPQFREVLDTKQMTRAQIDHAITRLGPNAKIVRRVPLIKRIEVDNPRPCTGETVRVDVVPIDSKRNMFYSVNTKPGRVATVRFNRPGRGKIYAVAKGDALSIDQASREIEVRECPERATQPALVVRVRPANPADTFELEVLDIKNLVGKPTFDWDFGDGVRDRTGWRIVRHSYALRRQDAPQSTFLATVTATDARGRTVTERISVGMTNTHWMATALGSPQLPAVHPFHADKTRVGWQLDVKFRNLAREALVFDKAEVTINQGSNRADIPVRSFEVPASAVLGDVRLEPGGLLDTKLRIPHALAGEQVYGLFVKLETAPAHGKRWTSMIVTRADPPPYLNRSGPGLGSALLIDENIKQKYRKARKLLGSKQVTLEEIRLLERQGRL